MNTATKRTPSLPRWARAIPDFAGKCLRPYLSDPWRRCSAPKGHEPPCSAFWDLDGVICGASPLFDLDPFRASECVLRPGHKTRHKAPVVTCFRGSMVTVGGQFVRWTESAARAEEREAKRLGRLQDAQLRRKAAR